MMDNIGRFSTIEPDKLHQRTDLLQKIGPGPVESHRAERESRVGDALAMLVDTRRHHDFIAGPAGGDGEFEPVRNEIPVLRDDEHQLSAPCRIGGLRRLRSDV